MFRSQNIELIFAEDLFPVLLPVEERARHWIHFFSLFSPFHLKALSAILSQKRRYLCEVTDRIRVLLFHPKKVLSYVYYHLFYVFRLQTEMRNYLVIQSKGKV